MAAATSSATASASITIVAATSATVVSISVSASSTVIPIGVSGRLLPPIVRRQRLVAVSTAAPTIAAMSAAVLIIQEYCGTQTKNT